MKLRRDLVQPKSDKYGVTSDNKKRILEMGHGKKDRDRSTMPSKAAKTSDRRNQAKSTKIPRPPSHRCSCPKPIQPLMYSDGIVIRQCADGTGLEFLPYQKRRSRLFGRVVGFFSERWAYLATWFTLASGSLSVRACGSPATGKSEDGRQASRKVGNNG
jgi:hypothetical protein